MNPAKFELRVIGDPQNITFQSIRPQIPMGCALRLKISRTVWTYRFQLFCKFDGTLYHASYEE